MIAAFLFTGMLWISAHGPEKESVDALTRAIRVDPGNARLYLRRAELLRHCRRFQDALDDVERCLLLDPEAVDAHLTEASTLHDMGEMEQALLAVDRSLGRTSNATSARVLRARILGRMRRHEEAVREYDSVLSALARPSPDLYLERLEAQAERFPRDDEKALAGLEQGMKKLGPIVALELPALDLEIRLQRFDPALARVERLRRIAPRCDQWLVNKGKVLASAGRSDEARRSFLDALALLQSAPRKTSLRSVLTVQAREALSVLEGGSRP